MSRGGALALAAALTLASTAADATDRDDAGTAATGEVAAVETAPASAEGARLATTSSDPLVPTSLRARDLGGARPEAAAMALAAAEGGSLAMALWAAALPGGGAPGTDAAGTDASGAANVLVVAELDGSGLAGADGAVPLEVTVYALDAGGGVAGFLAEGVRIPARRDLAANGVRYSAALTLPPGRYTLRVLALQRATRAFGLRSATVVVGGDAGAALPPMVFPAAAALDSGWAEVSSPRLSGGRESSLGGVVDLRPAALPVVALAGGAPLVVLADALSGARLELQPPGGGAAVAGAPLALAPAGGGRLAGKLPALPVAGGIYELVVVGRDGSGALRRTLPTRVATVAGTPRRWVAMVGAGGDPATVVPPAVAPAPVPPRSSASAEALARSYRAALARFAAGEQQTAVTTLRELHANALAADPHAGLGTVSATESLVDEELVRREPRVALPLADLHHRLYRNCIAAGRPGLALTALELSRRNLTRAVAAAESEDERRQAVDALLSLAASLFENGAPSLAGAVAAEAEKAAPAAPEPILVQAYVFERLADRGRASSTLDRLLKAHPRHREGRLRRAVLARRWGSPRLAEVDLRGLVADGVDDWVERVAAHELVALLVASGRPAEALTVSRGVADDSSLAIARVWATERSGRRGDAIELAERIGLAAAAGGGSRQRYRQPPEEVASAARRADETVLLRLAILAEALRSAPLESSGPR